VNNVLGERKKQILQEVIRDYITSAEPIGSSQIAQKEGIDLSPATVRTVMAELEERGYLKKSHASAGRTPTDTAYRLYVDELMIAKPPTQDEKDALHQRFLNELHNVNDIPRDTSRILSEFANQVGVATYPKTEDRHVEHIQFCKLKGNLVLAVLVFSSGLVENKILKLDHPIKETDLQQMHNYLNERLKGLTLREAKQRILEEIAQEKNKYDLIFQEALLLSQQTLADMSVDVHIEGQSQLFRGPDFMNFKEMRRLLRALEEKTKLAHVLEDCLHSPGIKIFIGDEFQTPEINGLALITAPYCDVDGNRGLLGVLGPTRVDYARIVPLVEYTSNLITKVLQETK